MSPKHILVNIIRVQDGLVTYRDTFPGGPAAFFGDVTQRTYVIKHALYISQTLLADGVMVGSHLYLPAQKPLGLPCLVKDLSLLCRLAKGLGYRHTKYSVV
jgi:hypothetical protein